MKQVLVTGANRGIGLEFVRQLAARGDQVFAAVRTPGRAGELQDLIDTHKGMIIPVTLDVADQGSVDAAYKMVAGQTDRLDILINNAGIFPEGERLGKLTREQ